MIFENEEILSWLKSLNDGRKVLIIPNNIFLKLNNDDCLYLIDFLGSFIFLMLPYKEIIFFEWLKINDEVIWNDLWKINQDEPYIVSISFLPQLLNKSRGFPICDLQLNDNYYFNSLHIINEESKAMLDAAKTRFTDNKLIDTAQLLAIEISMAPIDIWRFCFNHKIPIEDGKLAVASLVEDNILLHLKTAEEISEFIEF